MPFFTDTAQAHPNVLDAVGNWTMQGSMFQGVADPEGLAQNGIVGDANNRGTIHLGTANLLNYLVLRGGSNVRVVQSVNGIDWSGANILPQKSGGSLLTNPVSMRFVGGFLWQLGYNGNTGASVVMALPAGTELTTGALTSWIDRSADIPTNGSFVYYMRRALSAGKLFFLASQNANTTVVMSATLATATTAGFTNVTSVRIPDGNIGGYGVDTTGTIHLVCSNANVLYRSTNGGSTFSVPSGSGFNGGPATDFIFSSRFSRWCSNASFQDNAGPYYSDDNGATWTASKVVGAPSATVQAFFQFTHIEKMSEDGSIILGFSNDRSGHLTPINVWISLNGGKEWAQVSSFQPPYYDTSLPSGGVPILINTGSRLLYIMRGFSGDEAVFSSGMFGTPGYYLDSTDPRLWVK